LDDYKGVIIEESLTDTEVLKEVRILKTHVSRVTKRHKTPWLRKWTLHTVTIRETKANKVAKEISRRLDESHGESWYADFRNMDFHYIVFPKKIFKVNVSDSQQYQEVRKYGRDRGIPEYQLDFTSP